MSTTAIKSGKRSMVGRIFEILDCFADTEDYITIAAICEATGLPPATVHRVLSSLVEWGAVERLERGHYQLGRRMWRLGWGVPRSRVVRDIVRPYMVDLYARSGAIVVLATRDGDELLLVDQVADLSAGPTWPSSRRVPLGSLAPGLVYVAHLPIEEIRDLCARGIVRYPQRLVADEVALRRAVTDMRLRGVVVGRSRSAEGRTWISAPVLDVDQSVRTTMSLVLPDDRFVAGTHDRMVVAAARAASRALADPRTLHSVDAPDHVLPRRTRPSR